MWSCGLFEYDRISLYVGEFVHDKSVDDTLTKIAAYAVLMFDALSTCSLVKIRLTQFDNTLTDVSTDDGYIGIEGFPYYVNHFQEIFLFHDEHISPMKQSTFKALAERIKQPRKLKVDN